jgi:tRNA dimethylallyltransferase
MSSSRTGTPLPRVVAVVGTNASGKSALGVKLAAEFGGEIVSADSRQVYRGLDIGAGKLSREDRGGVDHHLLDVADPRDVYSLADYQRDAYRAIEGILGRGNSPFIVGGTGLYVEAVTEGYQLVAARPDPERRRELETLDLEELTRLLVAADPEALDHVEPGNRRRVVRAIEIVEAGVPYSATRRRRPRYEVLKLGVTWPRETLHQRIGARLRARIDGGMVEEVQGLVASGVAFERLEELGLEYRHVARFLRGDYPTRDELIGAMETAIRRFARRQSAWFRRDSDITWLEPQDDQLAQARALVSEFLSREDPRSVAGRSARA